jgi:acetylglutamate kinase
VSTVAVIKFGGELLEDDAAIRSAAAAVAALAARQSVVVVHGGGRAIDVELQARGETPRFIDGLRITDRAALDAAVAVLAGRTNTSLVAAIGAAGARAVGLTGADGFLGLCERVRTFTSVAGEQVDLGLVGHPVGGDAVLVRDLLAFGYVPVVASIGVDGEGALLNVNADALAAHLAAGLRADHLVIAGTTPGVLDAHGETIVRLGFEEMDELIESGAAHSGMVAKLAACRQAALGGVGRVAIVSGRLSTDLLDAAGTEVIAHVDGGECAVARGRAGRELSA